MRKRFNPRTFEQEARSKGYTGIAALAREFLKEKHGIPEEVGSSSVVSPDMIKGLAEILIQMDKQFSIRTSFFYMGLREIRDNDHPEIIRRPRMNVLEWLSLATKLQDVSPDTMKQLDAFCATIAQSQAHISTLSYRVKWRFSEFWRKIRRKFNPEYGRW